ncbi:MAG: helix-turn-helix domain-containing protein [Rikenellaceae bacterium]
MNNNQNATTSGSQCTKILAYLKLGNTLTALEALDMFQCFRLTARIWDIKQQGYEIERKLVTSRSGKRIAEYKLINN